ncbi:MAG: hypothetical protein AAGK05_09195 [Pseudomonadota bacterium]
MRVLSGNTFLQRSLSKHTNVEEEEVVFIGITRDRSKLESTARNCESNAPTTSAADISDTEEDEDIVVESEIDSSIVSSDESTAYFVGSLIRRLDCRTCAVSLGEKQKKISSTGFISDMTYTQSELYVPSPELLALVSAHIKPMSHFLNENLPKQKLVHLVYNKFQKHFDSLSWCSVAHKKTFLTFLTRTLIRILCKVRNSTSNDKKSKITYQKKLSKLNVL